MEILGEQRYLITKMSYFSQILNFYDYAYESVKLLRELCHETRDLWLNEQDAIARMFQKQTMLINNEPISIQTISMLKRNSKYKLFKFDFEIDTLKDKRLQVFYQMLDELPELEICHIKVLNSSNTFITALAEKPMFETKQDLFKILESNDESVAEQPEPHEYLSAVYFPYKHDMSCFVNQAKYIIIYKLEDHMNIECIAEQVNISSRCIQNLNTYRIGTQEFLDSVTGVEIGYYEQEKNVFENINIAYEYFKNLKYVSVVNLSKAPLSYIVQILSQCNIDHISFSHTKNPPLINSDNQVKSEEGCMVLYDTENALTINFKNFAFSDQITHYKIQGEYVIFNYKGLGARFDFKGVAGDHNIYNFLDLDSVKNPSIILHRKYIHELHAYTVFPYKVDYEPTKILKLKIGGMPRSEREEFIKYISSHSLEHLHTTIEICSSYNYNKDVSRAIFDLLNVKELIVKEDRGNIFPPQVYEDIK